MEAIVAVIQKLNDPTVLVLLLGVLGLGYMRIGERKEYREDLHRMIETLDKNTEVINRMCNILSAHSGKPVL